MLKSFSSNRIRGLGGLLLSDSGKRCLAKTLATKSSAINEEWKKLAQAHMKGKSLDTLIWQTAEVSLEAF